MTPRWYVSRRTVLRSAGASVALPFLEAMVKPGAAQAAGSPKRFVGVWGFPTGTISRRDAVQGCRVASWHPVSTGSLVGLTPETAPKFFGPPERATSFGGDVFLKPIFDAKLESKITIVSGLSDRQGGVGHNCAGILASAIATQTSVGKNGSADHVIATELKRQNPWLQHLVLSAADGGTGPLRKYISWAPNQPLPVDRNPREVFERLFGMAAAAGPVTAEAKAEAARREAYSLSILDSVKKEVAGVLGRVGRTDRIRLDQYLTGIRELEDQMKRAGAPAVAGARCTGVTAPAVTADFVTDPAKLDERVKLLLDVLVKGFECDRSRVASFMFAPAYGLENIPHLGLKGSYHNMSHYLSDAPSPEIGIAHINKWVLYVLQRYAYLLQEMDRRIEPDGSTMLDNSILHISGEHCDSHMHDNASMPILLGGRGGRTLSGAWTLSAGRHVRYPAFKGGSTSGPKMISEPLGPGERSVRDLLWAIIKAMGVNATEFGAATAPLDLTWADAVGP